MDRSRRATREGNEVTLQHKSAQEAARVEAWGDAKLSQLQASLEAMKQTPSGVTDLKRRIKAFGECKRLAEETATQFYERLRHWVDRALPQTKLPLHPPRQNAPKGI